MTAPRSDTRHDLLERLFRIGNLDFVVGMTVIGGNAHFLLQNAAALTDEHRASLSRIQHIANSFHRLLRTKTVLFHMITTAQPHPPREPVQLAPLLQEVADVVADPRNGHFVQVQLHLQDQLPPVYLNRDHLFLLFHTLATNALPFDSQHEVWIQAHDQDDHVCVTIQPIDTWSSEHLDVFALLVELTGARVLDKQAAHLSLALPKE